MSNFKLNLPTDDIPWKRICVTEDMFNRKIDDKRFPLRWQSLNTRQRISILSFQKK